MLPPLEQVGGSHPTRELSWDFPIRSCGRGRKRKALCLSRGEMDEGKRRCTNRKDQNGNRFPNPDAGASSRRDKDSSAEESFASTSCRVVRSNGVRDPRAR